MTPVYDARAVHRALQQPAATAVLAESTQRSLEHKRAAHEQVPWQMLRERAHAIKAHAIANLDRLLVQFEREFTARGGTVLWARTAQEAAERFLDICRHHGAATVVKGKSMLSEELELNARLQSEGIDSVETDLGDYIVQLAGQRPTHIIAPAIHLSRAEIGHLFERRLGVKFTDDPQALSMIARGQLRRRFMQAGLGMTGANFGIAQTGTVVVVENEGNGGLCAAVPPVHVIVMGIEKIIPRLDDLPVFLHLLARAGTGQKLTTYTHHFLGPEVGKTMYCLLVDAGRTALLADERTRESLYCIRCGACLNVCPIYRRVGGAAYGWVYPGPIGSVITPQMIGVRHAGELPFASTLCGACRQECPVDIDLPHQLVHMRSKAVAGGASGSAGERRFASAWAKAMSSVASYRRAVFWARAAMRLGRIVPRKPWPLNAWSRHRVLPEIAGETFKEWYVKRK